MKQLRSLVVLLGALSVLVGSSSLHAGIILTNIFSFNGTNGEAPTVLVRAGNNKFYGITESGGPNYVSVSSPDYGGVFSITSDGVFSNLCFFENTNGSYGAYLTPGIDSNYYGTTGDTVFKLNPDGTMANTNIAPQLPFYSDPFGLVQDSDGTIYGTTQFGGPSNYGIIYKVDTNGVFSTLATFNGTNAIQPISLLLGADNNFYGLARQGGNNLVGNPVSGGDGTIFRMDRSGNLTSIFLFSDLNDQPSWMVQSSDGDLYGATAFGGTNGLGSIFRITTNGVLVWSFSFDGTNGSFAAWLTKGNDGNFYGLTGWGGSGYKGTQYSGAGTIFRISPNGSFTSLIQLDGTNDFLPGTIVQGTDGSLYGTAGGGTYGLGTVFKLTLPPCPATNSLMLTTVANFNDTNSSGNDQPAVVQGNDGMLYGVTQHGGHFDFGSVFRSTLSGSVTTLASFNGTNGMYPSVAPTQAADGNFYGTTIFGGDYGDGTIYRIDTNGDLTTIFSFNGTNGEVPDSALVIGNDGALYGVTQAGGQNFTNANRGDGTIFKITTNGDFTSLASFNSTNGSDPIDIIQASDGNFYGTAVYGGIDSSNSNFGIVFQMTPDRQINTFVQFYGTNGWSPLAIIQASDGCLYGTTGNGGAFYAGADYGENAGYGTVFKVTTNGDFTLLASFDGTNGAGPNAPLLEVCKGVFYGTAEWGGLYPNGPAFYSSEGSLFQVTTSGDLTALLWFGGHYESVLPSSPVNLIKATDGNYYGGSRGPNQGSIFCIRPVQAPVLQPLAQAGQLNLNWNAWAGYSYNLMYETNLTGSNWNLLSTLTPQTNGITSYSDPIGPDTQRFYCVVLQLP